MKNLHSFLSPPEMAWVGGEDGLDEGGRVGGGGGEGARLTWARGLLGSRLFLCSGR